MNMMHKVKLKQCIYDTGTMQSCISRLVLSEIGMQSSQQMYPVAEVVVSQLPWQLPPGWVIQTAPPQPPSRQQQEVEGLQNISKLLTDL